MQVLNGVVVERVDAAKQSVHEVHEVGSDGKIRSTQQLLQVEDPPNM